MSCQDDTSVDQYSKGNKLKDETYYIGSQHTRGRMNLHLDLCVHHYVT